VGATGRGARQTVAACSSTGAELCNEIAGCSTAKQQLRHLSLMGPGDVAIIWADRPAGENAIGHPVATAVGRSTLR